MGLPRVAPALRLLRGLPDDARAIRARSLEALRALDLSDGVVIAGVAAPSPRVAPPLRWGLAEGAGRPLYERAIAPRTSSYVYTTLDLRLAPPIDHQLSSGRAA